MNEIMQMLIHIILGLLGITRLQASKAKSLRQDARKAERSAKRKDKEMGTINEIQQKITAITQEAPPEKIEPPQSGDVAGHLDRLNACTSVPTVEENDPYREVLVSMAPEAPVIPAFPKLTWTYQNGLYCITEEDADKLLDYGENELPLFSQRYDQYQRRMHLILDALAQP
jgi:hypothetical protein